MEKTQTPKKDLIYLTISFLLLVIIPITAGIKNNVEPAYYLIPTFISVFIIKYLIQVYKRLKECESRHGNNQSPFFKI